jgi:hypothetical protein
MILYATKYRHQGSHCLRRVWNCQIGIEKHGIPAVSCDILPSRIPGGIHIQDDVREHLSEGGSNDCLSPCTHLAVSGARWFEARGRT